VIVSQVKGSKAVVRREKRLDRGSSALEDDQITRQLDGMSSVTGTAHNQTGENDPGCQGHSEKHVGL